MRKQTIPSGGRDDFRGRFFALRISAVPASELAITSFRVDRGMPEFSGPGGIWPVTSSDKPATRIEIVGGCNVEIAETFQEALFLGATPPEQQAVIDEEQVIVISNPGGLVNAGQPVNGLWTPAIVRPRGMSRLALWYSQDVNGGSGITGDWFALKSDLQSVEIGAFGQTATVAVAPPMLSGTPGGDAIWATMGAVDDGQGAVGGYGVAVFRMAMPPRYGFKIRLSNGVAQVGSKLKAQWWA
jgi:hypothetical protein